MFDMLSGLFGGAAAGNAASAMIPQAMARLGQGPMNMFPGAGPLNAAQMAMQGAQLPDLMNPAGSVTSPLTQLQSPAMGNALMPGEFASMAGGPMPDLTRSAAGIDPNMAMLGLAAMQGREDTPAPRPLPGGGLAQSRMGQYVPVQLGGLLRR